MDVTEIRERCLEELDEKKRLAKEEKTTFAYRFKRYADRMGKGSKHT